MIITPPEINDALVRSGYLLEARVEKHLSDKWGAFVEANASYQDPDTGKSREIDIHAIGGSIAGPGEYDYLFPVLLVECINNPQPIAFLTKMPLVQFLYAEEIKWSGIPLKIVGKGGKWESITDYLEMEKFHHYCKGRTATQFCSFLSKGGNKSTQWMATHDETHFEAIRKLCDAVDYQIDLHMRSWTFEEKKAINLQIYYPVIVLQGELLDVRAGASPLKINKTPYVQFRRSVASKCEQRTYQIDVIRESYLPRYLKRVDEEVEKTLRLLRRRHERIRVSIDKIAAGAKRLRAPEKIRKALEM